MQLFFDPHSYAPPLSDPWDGLRSLAVPWLIVGAPLGATCLRLTLTLTRDELHENHVQTAIAKASPTGAWSAATPPRPPTRRSPRC